MDLRFEKLRDQKKERISELAEAKSEAHAILKALGPKKVSIYLMISEKTVNSWIERESVPRRRLDKILNLKNA